MTDDSDDDVSDLDLSSGNKDSFVIEVSFFVLYVLLLKKIMITFPVSSLSVQHLVFLLFLSISWRNYNWKVRCNTTCTYCCKTTAHCQQLNSSMVKPDKFRKSDCVGMCIWASGTYVIRPVPIYMCCDRWMMPMMRALCHYSEIPSSPRDSWCSTPTKSLDPPPWPPISRSLYNQYSSAEIPLVWCWI